MILLEFRDQDIGFGPLRWAQLVSYDVEVFLSVFLSLSRGNAVPGKCLDNILFYPVAL